jgi:hypothetical protein
MKVWLQTLVYYMRPAAAKGRQTGSSRRLPVLQQLEE